MKKTILFIVILCVVATLVHSQAPLTNAHAHNDYEHEQPLFDALSYGFTSVEADVHLVEGKLYVSHNHPLKKKNKQQLKALYLEPLKKLVKQNGGRVYPGDEGTFYLMIDLKTEAETTYAVLYQQLKAYQSMLTTIENGQYRKGAVTIFLSGNRPIEKVLNEPLVLATLDGRPSDLGKGYTAEVMPVISDQYSKHLKWRGNGAMPEEEWQKLQDLVHQVHHEGKKLRLWASPEKLEVWEKLYEAGVDFINTDQLALLAQFLKEQAKSDTK